MISDVGKLKLVKRTGWVRDGVKDAESVADHSYRTTVLAMLLSKKAGLDENKLIKMALVHDIGEAFAGDIVHERGNNKINVIRKKNQNLNQEQFTKCLLISKIKKRTIYGKNMNFKKQKMQSL